MKPKYTERLDVLYVPQAVLPDLADLNAVQSQRDGVKYEIPVFSSPRNREGFVTTFQKDLLALKRKGVVYNVIPTAEGAELIRDGKINPDTHATITPNLKASAAEAKIKANTPK